MYPTLSEAALGVKILVFVMICYKLWILAKIARLAWNYFSKGDTGELKEILPEDFDDDDGIAKRSEV